MRWDALAADPAAQKVVSVSAAGTSGAMALLTAIGEVTVAVLGVPLPVLLAVTTGAWVARAYTPSRNFFAAVGATLAWIAASCFLTPLVAAIAQKAWTGLVIPTNALAGLGLVIAAGLPLLVPVLQKKAPEILGAWLDKLKGNGK